MKYFTKTSAKKDKDSSALPKILAPIAIGGAAYAAMRFPRYSKDINIAKAQKASKGKVTAIVSGKPEEMMRDFNVDALVNKHPVARVKNWIQQGGIKHVRAEDLEKVKGPVKIKGAVYDDVAMSHPSWSPGKVKADVKYNANKQEFLNRLQNKQVFSQMKEFEGYTPAARPLSKMLPEGQQMTREGLYETLKDKDVFIKVKTGEGFGYGFQGKPEKILKASDKDFKHLIENPKQYIAQDFFRHDKEYRVHAMIQGGKVSVTEAHLKGYKGKHTLGPSMNVAKEDPELANFTVKALKRYARENKDKGNMIFGVDVMRNSKAGKFSIGEINDNSGSFRAYVPNYVKGKKNVMPQLLPGGKPQLFAKSPHLNYRQLTGRYSEPISAGVAVGATATSAAGIAITDKLLEKKGEDDNFLKKHKYMVGAAVGAAAMLPAFKILRKPSFSKDPALRAVQQTSKGKVTLVDPDLYMTTELKRVGEITHPKVQRFAEKALAVSDQTAGALIRKLRFPGMKTVNPDNVEKGTKFKGVVVNRASGTGKYITGDVTVNPEKGFYKKVDPLFNRKLKGGQLSEFSDVMPKSYNFDSLLKEHAKITSKQFSALPESEATKILKNIDTATGGIYIKPAHGERSSGLYTRMGNIASRPTSKIIKDYPKNPVAELQKNPSKYIMQEALDIDREFRIHTLGGKVIGDPQMRHFTDFVKGVVSPTGISKSFKTSFESKLNTTLKANKLDNPKKPLMLGWDVVKTKGGDFKVLEANTNSGFVFNIPPYSRNKEMYKALTGRRNPTEALAISAGVGVAAGGATAYGIKKTSAKKKDDKKVVPYILGGAAAITTAGAGYVLGKNHFTKLNKEYLRDLATRYRPGFEKGKELSKEKLKRVENYFFKGGAKKLDLDLDIDKKEGIGIGTAAVAGGAVGAAGAYYLPKEIKELRRQTREAKTSYVGRIPASSKYVSQVAKNPTRDITTKANPKSLGKFLRSQGKRFAFGDDSELQILGVDNGKVYSQNTFGASEGYSTKGKNYKIVKDQTVGGLEINVAPGTSDDLFRRYHRAITEGAGSAVQGEKSMLSGHAFMKTTGGVDVAASTHLHFQAKPEMISKKISRYIGATAPLNYLVSGAEDRAKGYNAYGAINRTQIFGGNLPEARYWVAPGEESILKKHGLETSSKKRAWMPAKGHVASEVRFNAPMYGDPTLGKKYLQLSELSLGETEHAQKFEALGEKIKTLTGGKSSKLYEPEIKKQVIDEFEATMKSMPFKDKKISDMISMMRSGQKVSLGNVVKKWGKYVI